MILLFEMKKRLTPFATTYSTTPPNGCKNTPDSSVKPGAWSISSIFAKRAEVWSSFLQIHAGYAACEDL
jgi:hypothetical protein